MNPKKWQKYLALGFIVFMLVLSYLPIFILIAFSFTELGAGNRALSFEPYRDLFSDGDIWTAALNTLILAGTASLIATIMGTFTAIGIFNMKSKAARAALSGANQIPVVNPDIVMGVSIMLLFVAIKDIGIQFNNEWVHLIIGHTVITTPFAVLAVMPRLRQLNPNVYEAALDLGATPFKATVKVLLPQLIPAMIAAFAIAFTLSLDDFVVTQYNNLDVDTISTYVYKTINSKSNSTPDAARAFSAILFVAVMGILVLVNIKSIKANKRKNIKRA